MGIIESNDRMTMNDVEAVVIHINAPGGPRKTMKNLSSY
jgi:hypothetical protein